MYKTNDEHDHTVVFKWAVCVYLPSYHLVFVYGPFD